MASRQGRKGFQRKRRVSARPWRQECQGPINNSLERNGKWGPIREDLIGYAVELSSLLGDNRNRAKGFLSR